MWNQYAGGASTAGTAPVSGPTAGSGSAPGSWHPTVVYMLALVVAEIILVGWLSRNLLS